MLRNKGPTKSTNQSKTVKKRVRPEREKDFGNVKQGVTQHRSHPLGCTRAVHLQPGTRMHPAPRV